MEHSNTLVEAASLPSFFLFAHFPSLITTYLSAWDGSSQEFNYHPLLMVTSMVFLFSEGTIELIFW